MLWACCLVAAVATAAALAGPELLRAITGMMTDLLGRH
jgi:hypothetical protein